MEENTRAERITVIMLLLITIIFIVVNYMKGWEFWIPIIIGPTMIGLFLVHLMLIANDNVRWMLYFWYAAVLIFIYSVHGMSRTHISLVFILFLIVFTLSERVYLLSMAMVEAIIVYGVFLYLKYLKHPAAFSAMDVIYVIVDACVVLFIYMFSRSLLKKAVELRKELKLKEESREANDRNMEDFLSNISHELRTPINVISGMTTLLMKDVYRGELFSIRLAGLRLTHQVEDIQDYTEVQRGSVAIAPEAYMTISMVNDMVSEYHMIETKGDLDMVVDLDPSLPASMKGDIKKIQKMFRHVVENAFKFTSRGGVYIHLTGTEKEYGTNLLIEVTDTGPGISRKEMSLVTKGMYQSNKKRNRSSGGIGLGLSIVFGFAHRMGGFVTIESEGSGTTVRISIPQEVVDPSPCLSVDTDEDRCIVFYDKIEKHSVPEVREFYRLMASHLATSLGVRLYAAATLEELDKMLDNLPVSHIFMGQDEYEERKEYFNSLGEKGYTVVVSSDGRKDTVKVGNVTMTSKPIYGFPIVRILNEDRALPEGVDDNNKLLLTGVSALIVDDEPMNLVVATGLFREYQMITDTANSGQESLDKYESGDYDVIFMDHMMPGMDGVEAMKRLRDIASKSGRSPVIVALTANALSSVREMLMHEGFDGFIAKPIDVREFERVMRNVLPEEKIHYEGRANA